jgi:hypothetical protein
MRVLWLVKPAGFSAWSKAQYSAVRGPFCVMGTGQLGIGETGFAWEVGRDACVKGGSKQAHPG